MSNILSHVNYDGKVLDIKDSSTAPYIVTAPKNSDITTKLQTALNNGNVELLGGSYVVSKTITVPYGTTLNGNGAVIKPKYSNNFGDFVITINTYNGNNADDHSSTQTAVYNLNIDCLYKCSGIHLIQRGAKITGVNITNPIKSGYGIAVRLNPVNDTPGDMNITNCGVYSPDFNNHNHNIGLYIGATDCVVDGFRSIGSKIGIEMASTSGSNFLCNCHPLAFSSTTNGWDDTVGFDVNASVYMINCYSDNFRIGIKDNGGYRIAGTNFYNQYFEMKKSAMRTAFNEISDHISLNLKNIQPYPFTYAAVISQDLFQEDLRSSMFTTVPTTFDKTAWSPNDLANLIDKKGGYYTVQPNANIEVPVIAMGSVSRYTPPVLVNITSEQFAIINLLIKFTTGNNITIMNKGELILNTQEVPGTAGITLKHYKRDDGVAFLTLSNPTNMSYWNITVSAPSSILALPQGPLDMTGTLEQTINYSA